MPIDLDYEYGPADDYYSADQLADLGVIWPDDISKAIHDVIAERDRQMSEEGWTPAHDDEHSCGELAAAAACYAVPAPHGVRLTAQDDPPKMWPWQRSWWKPKDRRRNLVRAAALIIAEIDRLDRAESKKV